jgi:hypothetical protein
VIFAGKHVQEEAFSAGKADTSSKNSSGLSSCSEIAAVERLPAHIERLFAPSFEHIIERAYRAPPPQSAKEWRLSADLRVCPIVHQVDRRDRAIIFPDRLARVL